MKDITLRAAQQQVDVWIKKYGVKYFGELTNLGILMEEVGELSRIMVRKYGEQSFKKNEDSESLSDEMADPQGRINLIVIKNLVDAGSQLAQAIAR